MGSDQSQLQMAKVVKKNQIDFTINGKEYSVNIDNDTSLGLGPKSVLLDFIRDKAILKGTKNLCREGGCGACVISVKTRDKATGAEIIRAVNSCLTPIFSCDGWEITTIEALGNYNDGYHKIQNKLVSFGGTQCGFCTPGMVMNMYSLTESNKKLGMVDIEDALDGNLCRCTGYRPILDAFKSLASDASPELVKICQREKDAKIYNKCANCSCSGKKSNADQKENSIVHLSLKSGEEWIKPDSLDTLFEVIQKFKSAGSMYRLIDGNTGMGVYKDIATSDNYIDITAVPELKTTVLTNSQFQLGGGVTLSMAIDLFLKSGEFEEYKSYGEKVAKHIKRVANTPVRNAGTLAGNLMLKHFHKEFPSDLFVILEALNAKLSIASAPNLKQDVSPAEFLQLDMNGKIILSIELPQLKESEGWIFKSFKITKRYQNSHAYVNAAFVFKLNNKNEYNVIEKPRLVYGGISPTFIHAEETENFLINKSLKDQFTIKGATDSLDKEINPDFVLPDATPEYRKSLSLNLFYKFVLSTLDTIESKVKSGGDEIERKLTSGKQTYDTDKSEWPINQPIHKIESYAQCSGEAEYTNDIHPQQNELFGVLLQSTVANADLSNIDPAEALQIPGVVAFISAKDIPGENNYQSDIMFTNQGEEIFVSKKVQHAGACLGMLVGENREVVTQALGKIKVNYTNVQKPILNIIDSLNKSSAENKRPLLSEEKETNYSDAKNRIKGEFKIGGQYHFTMEPHTCIVIPKEDSTYDIFASTQWMAHAQTAVSQALNIPQNNINIAVKRLGGGYGAKITRTSQIIAAAAVGAHKTGKAVRIVLDLDQNMNLVGKRQPYYITYDVGFDDNGKIFDAKIKLICDPGFNDNENTSLYSLNFIQNCYNPENWTCEYGTAKTNTHANTWCRAPGSTESIAAVECIMEHISQYLKKDPIEIRLTNLVKEGDPNHYLSKDVKFQGENLIPKMINEIKQSSEYDARRKSVDQFNLENRWKKRGMGIVPIKYALHYGLMNFPVFIAIYHGDGSLSITHGGIEMGQGINTKIAQVVAKQFEIPLEKVRVKPSNNLTGPNTHPTGAAVTSELVSCAAIKACEIIKKRMEPIREKLGKDAEWEKVVDKSYRSGIELTASYLLSSNDNLKEYDVYGVTVLEVEIDVLTGENKIVRADLIEDTGYSISPEIDIGQVEGAFIMGIGYWTTEQLLFDPDNGQLLTNNTWNYKIPMSKDIPEDFRITFLKNTPNPTGILRSKATGMGVSIVLALRDAIKSARKDAGATDEFFQIDTPVTNEEVLKYCLTSKSQFVL